MCASLPTFPYKLLKHVRVIPVIPLVAGFSDIELDMLVVVMGSMKRAFDNRPEPLNRVGMHLAILTKRV
jgi:hypothetical protein